MESLPVKKSLLNSRKVLALVCIGVGIALQSFAVPFAISLAEQIGSSPESGVDSRLQQAYQSVTNQGHGLSPVPEWTSDWGSRWNRIMAAASWTPGGDVLSSEVIIGKTYLSGDRTEKTGTLNLNDFSQIGLYQQTSYRRQASTSQALFPPDISGGWTQLVASGGSPASVTANGATLALDSTRVMRDSRTSLIWTDSTTTTTFNPFIWTNSETNLESPSTRTCNLATAGNANQWCNVSDYVGYDNSGWAGWADPNNVAIAGDQARDTLVSANEMCLNLSADDGNGLKTDWRLPTQREFMIAYLNGGAVQLPNVGRNFWASTQHWSEPYNASSVYLRDGSTGGGNKWTAINRYVRCVRES